MFAFKQWLLARKKVRQRLITVTKRASADQYAKLACGVAVKRF